VKLYTSARAPNPRRVRMFIAEKDIQDIQAVEVDLLKGEQRADEYRARNPFAQTPALELDDGRVLTETRAISSYLEFLHPEPNLMGREGEERAFVEMWDRRVEFGLAFPLMHWARHSHPALAVLEGTQIKEHAAIQQERARAMARWFDGELAGRGFIAGDRFTIADITAFCAIEFARLVKWTPAADGLANLQRWRDAVAARPSAAAG
jgi:glutathione S-transferase